MPAFGSNLNSVSEVASFCAANPTDPRCNGSSTQTPQYAIAGYVVGNFASATPGVPSTTSVLVPGAVVASAWYTQWWGIGLIGVLAFLGYKHFVSKPKPKQ